MFGDRQARNLAATSRPYEAAGEDATYISRIREDATVENGLVLWCVSDNLRQGRRAERGPDRRMPDQPQN